MQQPTATVNTSRIVLRLFNLRNRSNLKKVFTKSKQKIFEKWCIRSISNNKEGYNNQNNQTTKIWTEQYHNHKICWVRQIYNALNKSCDLLCSFKLRLRILSLSCFLVVIYLQLFALQRLSTDWALNILKGALK